MIRNAAIAALSGSCHQRGPTPAAVTWIAPHAQGLAPARLIWNLNGETERADNHVSAATFPRGPYRGPARSHPRPSFRAAAANPIPFVIDDAASEQGTLKGHLTRANPQWRDLAGVDECLRGRTTTSARPGTPPSRKTGKVVPTWNDVTVHAWGRPRVTDDVGTLRAQIEVLTGHAGRCARVAVASQRCTPRHSWPRN
jgi:hypothetical protein